MEYIKNTKILAGLFFALALFADSTFGQINAALDKWLIVGPNGGDVRTINIDPSNKSHLYFSTLDGQVYESRDSGKTWRLLVNFNSPLLILDDLIVDPRDSKIIYVSGHKHTQPGGFFRSTDGGKTWQMPEILKKEAIHAMTQSVSDPNMLLVGSVAGIFISKDSGESWSKIEGNGLPGDVIIDSLAIDPVDTNIIYAGTTWRAYKTTDGGKNWRIIKDGMIDDSDVFAIEIDRQNTKKIIASACSGIYDSTNGGEKWKKVQGIPSQSRRTRDIMMHPTDSKYVYAGTTEGFWMSSDGGNSWGLTTSRQLEVNSIAVHSDQPERVYIATNNYGVMVSDDYGKTFSMTNGGFSTRLTSLIAPDNADPKRFYAATINTATGGGFFFISNDGGLTWVPSMKNIPSRLSVNTLLQDKADPNQIYIGTNFGLYRSTDRGASWALVTAPIPKKTPVKRPVAKKTVGSKTAAKAKTPVKVEPKTPVVIRLPALTDKINALSFTNDGKNGILAATQSGLYRSYNINEGWEKLILPTGIDNNSLIIRAAENQPNTVWLATARSGVLISRDGGATWDQNQAVPAISPASSIVVDPKDANRIYIGTKQTLYISRDGGKMWMRRGGGLPVGDYASVTINPNNPDEIFAGSAAENENGLFRTLDGGNTWKRVDTKDINIPSRRIWTLTFAPDNSGQLFIGTHSAGIYRLTTSTNEISGDTRPRIANP